MTTAKKIAVASNTQLNAKVVEWQEMSLEPLRGLFSDMGPDTVVDDLDEMISLINSIVYQKDDLPTKFCRKYLQDRLYAMLTLKKHFLALERSMVQVVKEDRFQQAS